MWFIALFWTLLLISPASADDRQPQSLSRNTVVLVDKSKNLIHLANYGSDQIEIQKSWHATLGKVLGDKEVEKDLKTPEGIYFFVQKISGPGLNRKLGKLALLINYPNPVDKLRGKTGYSIMVHGTDDPPRLKRDLDSEGCVVLDDSQVAEISNYIIPGITPLMVFPELKAEYLKSSGTPGVQQAFERWLKAWQGKDLETYIGSYLSTFRYNGMNLKAYREYKASLNSKYSEITIKAEGLKYYFHPKYDVVSFTQIYESRMKNGNQGFKSSGTKFLYFIKDGSDYRIASEEISSRVLN